MQRRVLWAVFAMLFVLTLHCIAFAANETSNSAKKFDQKAELERLWTAPDNTVVGSVNGVKVTKGELLKMMWFTAAPNMLQDLLNQKMIQEAARKANVKLEWSEVQDAINKSLQRMNAESMDQLLNQYKITWYRFMSGIKLSALAEKLVAKEMKITDAQYAEWVKARHILVRFPQDEQDRAKAEADAKAKIDAILARVKGGEDFAKVADEVSEDPGNIKDGKKQGGDLGWFTRGRMVQEFENAAFQMKAGEISEPVKTFYGYHIIKLEKLGKDATEAEKAELRNMIIERDMPMKIGQWFSNLQNKSTIENKLMPPAPKQPKPVIAPSPAPKVRPAPAPKPSTKEPKVEQKTAPPAEEPSHEPQAGENVENVPPPPPPAE